MLKFAGAAVAALATLSVFPPIGWSPVAWVALVPWLLALDRASACGSILVSSLFALMFLLPLGAWIPEVALGGFGASLLGGYGLWLVTSLSYAPAILTLGALLSRVSLRSAAYPLVAGTGWALVELSHAFVWPQIPWVVVGATQIDTPLSALAAISGVHSVSAVVVAGNALIVQALGGCQARQVFLRVVIGGLAVGAAATAGHQHSLADIDGTLRVAVVQPGIGLAGRGDSRSSLAILDAAMAAIGELRGPAIFILPENLLNASVEARPDLIARLATLATERDAAFLFGVHRRTPAGRLNSVAVLEPGRPAAIVYDKRRLLPIAEAVPPWMGPRFRRSLGRLVPHHSFRAGGHEPIRPTGLPARVELVVCYEAAFSSRPLDPRAQLIVNVANDGWYDSTPAAQHLLLLSRWRAVEQAAPLVRAALTGVSAILAPDGSIDASIWPDPDSVDTFGGVGCSRGEVRMAKERQRYEEAFKAEAVRLVLLCSGGCCYQWRLFGVVKEDILRRSMTTNEHS